MNDDNLEYLLPEPLFTTTERRVLQNVRFVVAPFSLAGSFLIFHVLHRDKLIIQQSSPTFRRIMMGLCFFDLLSSAAYLVLGPWAIPADSTLSYNPHGTQATCDIMGLLLHQMLGSGLYSTCLALYHCLVIVYGYKEEQIAKRIEPIMHFIAIGFPIITGAYAVSTQNMNPLENVPGICWIAPHPWHCTEYNDIVPCERGENYYLVNMLSGAGLFVPCGLLMAVCMGLIFRSVLRTEQRLRKYAGSGRAAAWEMSRKAGWTSIRYVVSFYLTFVFAVLLQTHQPSADAWQFALTFLAMVFLPLIGLFNAFIFFAGGRFQSLLAKGRGLHFLTYLWTHRGDSDQAEDKNNNQKQVEQHPNPMVEQQSQAQPQTDVVGQPVQDNTESQTGEEDGEQPQTEETTTTAHGRHRPSPLLLAQWKSSRKLLGSTRDLLKNSLDFESSLRAVPEMSDRDERNHASVNENTAVQPAIEEEEGGEGEENEEDSGSDNDAYGERLHL